MAGDAPDPQRLGGLAWADRGFTLGSVDRMRACASVGELIDGCAVAVPGGRMRLLVRRGLPFAVRLVVSLVSSSGITRHGIAKVLGDGVAAEPTRRVCGGGADTPRAGQL